MKCVWILRQVIRRGKKYLKAQHIKTVMNRDKLKLISYIRYAILAEIMILHVVRMLFTVKQ